jgi:hypothetical protein
LDTALHTAPAAPRIKNVWVFAFLWLLTFILYLPAAKAGWVIDSAGWLYNIRNLKFWDYINNKQSGIPSLYQFTQLVTWCIYKVFNANALAWHIIMVSLHAVNAFLFFIIFRRLFDDSGIRHSFRIAIAGVVLYTVCPHISEVIVWEASFHYLQGFLFILIILYCLQQFLHTRANKYAWIAGIVYLCSTYSLEIFYLTPWFTLVFALYYRYVLDHDKNIFKQSLYRFFVPQLILFGLHIAMLLLVYNHFAHIAENVWQPFSSYISRPPFYIFHILFFGRYFPQEIRKDVYGMAGSNAGLIIFYNIFVLLCLSLYSRFAGLGIKAKAGVFLLVCIMISQVILMPLAFPDFLLCFFDRYTYFTNAFIYMLVALLISYISNKFISTSLLSVYVLLNMYFTVKLNVLWKRATYIDNRLLHNLPDPGNRTVLLLNMPENMKGVPMIGAQPIGEYKMMHELFVNKDLHNKVYDVQSYNMLDAGDGAHVTVINDSVIKVTLNEWGTWWWYEGHGGYSYQNEDYRLDMRDPGHWFDVTLKHPASQYLLLYQQGDQWREVNMNKKNDDQY